MADPGPPCPPGTPVTDAVLHAVRGLARRQRLPAYVYDHDHLDAHVGAVVRALRAGPGRRPRLLYAVKANPDPGVLAVVAGHVDGFEVASAGEIEHVRRLHPAVPLVFGGPGKSDADLAVAIAAGVHRVTVESRFELLRWDAAARAAGTVVPVLLRVNPPGEDPPRGRAAALVMGGAASPFGMDPAEADACAAALDGLPGVRLVGVHAHRASGLDPDGCAAHGREVLAWAGAFAARHRIAGPLEVDVGGGMAVDYRAPARTFDWADYARRLLAPPLPVDPEPAAVWIEPGRALAAYSGWYATRVLDVKSSRGQCFAICAGGTHHLRTPVAKGHDQPLVVVPTAGWDGPERPDSGAGDVPVTFVGQLCTPKDVLARAVPAGRVRAGDLVVFAMAGAYAYNISHHDFLMHPPPDVVRVGGRTGTQL
jgi:diaminopimelate decarboxylase